MNLIITCYTWSLVSALSSCPGHPLVLRNLAKGSPWSETAWPDLNLGHKIQMLRLPFPWLDTSLCRYVVFTFHVLSVFEKFTKTMSDKWPKFPFSLTLHRAETFLTVWFWIQFILSHSPTLCIISAVDIANRMQWLSWTEEFLWQT